MQNSRIPEGARRINVMSLLGKKKIQEEQKTEIPEGPRRISVENLFRSIKRPIYHQSLSNDRNMNLYLMQNMKAYVQSIGGWEIEWNILKKEELEKINGIFSMSFYRKKGYNSRSPEFLVYKNGLIERIYELINFMNDIKFNIGKWKIRIYYERSVKEDIIEILNLPILKINDNLFLIELFEYFYTPLSNNSKYHFESFGMFMRLLPLIYDNKNKDILQPLEEELTPIKHYFHRVLVIDIDRKMSYVRKCILKKYLYDKTIKLGYDGRESYNFYDHIDCYDITEGQRPLNFWPIINCFIYQCNLFYPYDLFINFFDESMELWMRNNESGRKKYKNKCMMNIFGYGYDEYFTNNYMLRYYLDRNINIELYLKGGYYGLMYGLLKFIMQSGFQNNENIRRIFTDIFMLFSYQNKLKKLKWENLRTMGMELIKNGVNYRVNERFVINGNPTKYMSTSINLNRLYQNTRKLKATNDFHIALYDLFHESFYRNLDNDENITNVFAFPHKKFMEKMQELIEYLGTITTVPQNIINSFELNKIIYSNNEIYRFVKAIGRRELIIKSYIINKRTNNFKNIDNNIRLNSNKYS